MKQVKQIIVFYLVLGPINWFPGVSPAFVNIVKYVLFSSVLLLSIRNGKIRMLNALNFNVFLLTMAACIPAIVFGKGNLIFNLLDFIFIFLVSLIVASLNFSQQDWLKIFHSTVSVFSVMAFFFVVLPLIGINPKAPKPWAYSSLDFCGLGGYRTGWSNSIFLFVPFLAYLSIVVRNIRQRIFYFAGIAAILILQLKSGGRAGLIASVLSIVLIYRTKAGFLFLLLMVGWLTYESVGEGGITSVLRINKESYQNKRGTSDLDKISSGRVQGYEASWDLIRKNPLIGYGFNHSDDYLSDYSVGGEVHNTYLKRWMEGGIFLILMIGIILFRVQKSFLKSISGNSSYFRVFGITFLIIPVLVANGEPNYLFGSFQGESFFWFVILALTGSSAKQTNAPVSKVETQKNQRLKPLKVA